VLFQHPTPSSEIICRDNLAKAGEDNALLSGLVKSIHFVFDHKEKKIAGHIVL
jgi:hypothetical protein